MITPWPPFTERSILLVAGLGRCGTSLMMQMLDAGGFPVVGSWADYEDSVQLLTNDSPDLWRANARGRAIKALDPQRWTPPAGEDYRIIWLDRHPREQAASQFKFVQHARGEIVRSPSRVERLAMRKILKRDHFAAQKALLAIDTAGIVGVKFEDLITRPANVAAEINAKLGGVLDEAAMVRQVVKRGTECFEGLLEPMLMMRGRR